MNMSTHAATLEYKELANVIKQQLELWSNMLGRQTGTVIATRLNDVQLAMAAAVPPLDTKKMLIIFDGSVFQTLQFKKQLGYWQDIFSISRPWHVIEGTLSDQERSGLISTSLTQAWHSLLSPQEQSHSILLPASLVPQPIPDRHAYQADCIRLTVGEIISHQELIGVLQERGYIRHRLQLEPGSFRLRGEYIDIAHPCLPAAITIHFFGKKIEQITQQWQRRSRSLPGLLLPPMRFPDTTQSWAALAETYTVIRSGRSNLQGQQTLAMDALAPVLAFPFQTQERSNMLTAKEPLVVFYENLDRVQAWAAETKKNIQLVRCPLANTAVSLTSSTLTLVSEEVLLPQVRTEAISRTSAFELIGKLTVGRPAVHSHHGIGMYEGLQTRTVNEVAREYLVLRYAQGDSISVPVEYAHKVTPYIGEGVPKIHRLSGTAWQKTKRQAEEDAAAFAEDLLAIASRRQEQSRSPYTIDTGLETKLEQDFPYPLTPDQARTWQEVKQDLMQATPMDRLIVGDVGFGKTEIALRAACHVAANRAQVALIAPTTLLAQQHYDTCKKRLQSHGFSVALLSRTTHPKEQRTIHEKTALGHVQVVIGTHALLSKHMKWAHLGLVIIDEEQRFGVRHKEHFKKLRATVDILSLSATPIPRSLSMALSGLRQLSVIATAPAGRQDVETVVAPFSDDLLTAAVTYELARGGQVYIVAPKISQLPTLAARLLQLVPFARTQIAHGRMQATALAQIMHDFDQGRTDVLIASSIIENGLDLPNANTIIVTPATHFGLSDLYQLRGRIGRRARRGYAYFLYQQQELTPIQKQRLTALTQASRVGSGWMIAQHDLEIRGAGNLLGKQQSGTVNAVGVQLYLDLIEQALHGEKVNGGRRTEITLPLPAIIPAHYIADIEERTRWYQRASRARSLAALEEHNTALQENFGPLPLETQNLLLLIRLQLVAGSAGIHTITSQRITPSDEDPYWQLHITGKNLPEILRRLAPLGRWQVKNDTAQLGVDDITAELIQKIIDALSV